MPIMEVSIRIAKRGYIHAKKDKESHIQPIQRCPGKFRPDSHSRYGSQQEYSSRASIESGIKYRGNLKNSDKEDCWAVLTMPSFSMKSIIRVLAQAI
jgi:hypothetical protein